MAVSVPGSKLQLTRIHRHMSAEADRQVLWFEAWST
jgi:hypothetical protein